jgi:predicted Zn finger-like uncharacterized protein
MYTQCPDCQTRFRVTASVLRAAHGTVRCGRCGGAFDALERLSDALEATAEPVLEPLVIAMPPLSLPSVVGTALEEPVAEPTEVLVDETATTETITLEGEHVSVDIESESGEPDVRPEISEEPPPPVEIEGDLDATDRYEILELAESQFPDDRDAERELEALVQRLQREFGPDIIAPDDLLDRDEDTAETSALVEPETPDVATDETTFVDVSPDGAVTSVPESWVVSVLKMDEPVPVDQEPTVSPSDAPASEPAPEPAVAVVAGPDAPHAAAPGPAPLSIEPAGTQQARIAAAQAEPPSSAEAGRFEDLPLPARRFRTESVEAEAELGPDRSPWSTLAWSAGSLLLAIALAAQVVHHWRDTLARDARFGGVLRAAYAQVGLELPPSQDLAAFELRQLGVDDRDAGRLVVRATLTNRATFTQPMPILRLQLEDRFGSMVAARDFEPSEYFPNGVSRTSALTPGATGEAELVLADPGPEAVGYRLDVCLRDPTGQLLCAQPPGPG